MILPQTSGAGRAEAHPQKGQFACNIHLFLVKRNNFFFKKLTFLVGGSKQISDNKFYEEFRVTVCVSVCVILEQHETKLEN